MATVANLFIRISASATEFEKTLKSAEASFNRTGAKWQAAGANLTKGVTLPIVAVGGAAIKAAINFESSFAGIRKTVDATDTQFAELSQQMRDMAKIKPVNVNELNRIGEIGGQLGIGADGLREFTDVVSDMTIATDLSAESAAFSMARIAKLTNTPIENIRHLGDVIAKLGDDGASTEAEITNFAERIAGTGNLAGFSADGILSIGAAFSNVGIEAEAGGTAVQKVFTDMLAAVQMGGDQLQAYSKVIGEDFAAVFNRSPDEAFLKFVQGLEKAGASAVTVLKGLGIDDQRQIRAFASLAAAQGTLQRAYDTTSRAQGKLKEEVEIFANTTESKLKMFWNAVEDVGITIGQTLIPQLTKLGPAADGAVRSIAGLAEQFTKLPAPIQEWSLALLGLGVALGPAAYAIGTIQKAIAAFYSVLRSTGIAAAIGSIGKAIFDLGWLIKGFGWEGFIVGLRGFGAAIFTIARASPIGFFITLAGIVKSLGATWTETFAIMAAPPIGIMMNSWRQIREGYDMFFGTMGMPKAPGAPKAKTNKPLGKEALEINSAMSLLDQQLTDTSDLYRQWGNAGADALGKVKKKTEELLQATRAIPYDQLLSTGFTGPGGLGAGMQGSLGGLMAKLKELNNLADEGNGRQGRYGRSLQEIAIQAGMGDAPTVASKSAEISQMLYQSAEELAERARRAADDIANAFSRIGGSLSAGASAIFTIAGQFVQLMASGKLGKGLQKLFGGKVGQGIGIGIDAFAGGFGFGEQLGKGKGALAGAGSGALAGFAVGGPIGALIGGAAGLLGGLFGGGKKKREEMRQMEEARAQLLDQFGGMEKLQDIAARAGVSVDKLFSTTKAKEFQAEMENVTAAIKAYQEKIQGIVTELDKVMSEGGLIGADLWKEALANLDAEEVKAKLLEVFDASVNQSAEGFNKIAQNFELIKAPLANIGVLADAAFGGLLANGASVVEAINQLGPGLQHIQEVLAKTGQTPTGPLADILNYQKVVEANAGIFELLSGVDDMLVGLANSGLLTQTSFSALGQTITQAFTQLTANGVAGTTALQLMQPQLQKLWELQKQFGFAVDSNTQSLLTQAEQQGIVGAQMQSTDQKILDVLIAIGTALGATIPEALLGLPPIAEQAAAGVGAAFDPAKITPKFQAIADAAKGALNQIPNQIPIDLRLKLRGEEDFQRWLAAHGGGFAGGIPGGAVVPAFAKGGIVTRPTLGIFGEAGPEAVVPLDKLGAMGRSGGITIERVYGTVDRAFVKSIARQVAQGGDTKTAWQGALK